MKKAIRILLTIIFINSPLILMESCDEGLGSDQPADGQIMFWSDFDGAPIDIYIDNKYEGTISQFFTTTPNCGSDGCVTVTLTPDTYSFHAVEQQGPGSTGQVWNGNVTIKINSCGALNLTASTKGVMLIASETNCSASVNSN